MSTKQETNEQTTVFPFNPYAYKVEKEESGYWRALYQEYAKGSWRPCKYDFDFGVYERTYVWRRSAEKACRKHAERRRQEWANLNEPAVYLGLM